MKPTTSHKLTACLAASLALALGACDNDAEQAAPTSTGVTSESARTATTPAANNTATPKPDDSSQTSAAETDLSVEEQDEAAIEETLQAYTAALSQAMIGEESIEGIYPYSRDAAREQWVTQVMAYEAQGITASGTTELEVLEISLDGDAAEVKTCVDLSDIEAVEANGDSYISEDRLDQSLNHFVLERDDSAEVGWYVIEDTNRNEPCDG